jgi:hypothetical protein
VSFDFDAAVSAPFRMQPGLRRLPPGAKQLSVAPRDSRHLHDKLAALLANPHQALLCIEGFDAVPALHVLARQAAAEHPSAFVWDGSRATAIELGWSVCACEVGEVADRHAPLAEVGRCLRQLSPEWRLAGLLSLAFAEDFAIIDGDRATIPWLAVALPSHWDPLDKIGRHFAQVHAPVADSQLLLAAGEALARLVSSELRWERFVWTITSNPHLNAHPTSSQTSGWPPGDSDGVARHAWWRTERQTFIPVAGRQQAVFTILVEIQPLLQAMDNADKARRVHDALATMSPAVLEYRGLAAVRERLLQWLARRAEE